MSPAEAERTRLQAELDAQRTQRQRNVMGQFATPDPLAVELLKSARDMTGGRTGGIRFMDPAFGTGSFYSALLDVFRRQSVAAAYGYEIDPHYGRPASRLWEPAGLRLELSDFTARRPGDDGTEPVDLLVCNPPYVRHHHIERETKLRLGRRVNEELGIRVSGLAGLYVYFMLLSHPWLRPDGLSIWLIPSEFMDVNYGSALKEYLLNQVDLIRIHRFEPSDVQFADALVSSAVVWFRNRAPAPGSAPEFTLGGSLGKPRLKRRMHRDELRRESKWTRFPAAATASDANGATLGDFFTIKRGIATGANRFFIMDERRAETLSIPSRFLRPILPSPRYVRSDVVAADQRGVPKLDRPLFLFDCHLPFEVLEQTEPQTAGYLKQGESEGVHEGYLASRRHPWYAIEGRDPAPFLCTYMGRSANGAAPFRVILNQSRAIATNVYLMLYPREPLKREMADEADERAVLASLNQIVEAQWETNRRVYGGGLYKVEPRELGSLAAAALVDAFPGLESVANGQMRLELAGKTTEG